MGMCLAAAVAVDHCCLPAAKQKLLLWSWSSHLQCVPTCSTVGFSTICTVCITSLHWVSPSKAGSSTSPPTLKMIIARPNKRAGA